MPPTPFAVAGGRALVFAHRGGAAVAPENTCAAFDRAAEFGADGLELDVRLSSDGVVMVHHDRTLDRTTDGRGRLSASTADEIARFDAGCRFVRDGEFPFRGRGVGVPRLADVLARYPTLPIIIELKGTSEALARAVVEDVRRAGALERVCVGGYSRRALRAARRAEPRLVTSAAREEVRWALYCSWLGLTPPRTPYQALQVPEYAGRTRIVSRRFVAAAHRAGRAVQVWVVDAPADVERLLDWGVDGIITDRPDVVVPIVSGRRPTAPRRPAAPVRS